MTVQKNGFAVHDLTVCYPDGVRALDTVRVSFPAGGVTAIIGESGSGKSTLGQALYGALPQGTAVSGKVLFGDVDVTACTAAELRARYWGKQWGIVPQLPRAALSPVHRIARQMADVRRGAGRPPWDEAAYAELLARFGFDDPQRVLHAYPHELSGGMLQRVLCAMADAGEPSWILADEPTKGLDPDVWQMVAENLHCLTQRQGVSLLLITHDIPLARRLADRVVVMQAGRIVAQGRDVGSDPHFPYREAQRRKDAAAERIPVVDGSCVAAHEGQPSASVPEEEALLAAEGVSKRMRDRMRGTWMNVLTDCSLRVAAGRTVGLEGRSGAGKSTLVRILLGLLRPDEGTVCWNGRDIRALQRTERLAFRRGVQLVVQNPEQAFDPRRSIGGSLSEAFAVHPVLLRAGTDARAQIVETLSAVELTERVLTRHPHELSGGELQRAAIARALLTEPRILLLDEPTTMLDISLRAQIMELLLRLRVERGLGMLLISHERELLRDFADEIHVLEAGRVR